MNLFEAIGGIFGSIFGKVFSIFKKAFSKTDARLLDTIYPYAVSYAKYYAEKEIDNKEKHDIVVGQLDKLATKKGFKKDEIKKAILDIAIKMAVLYLKKEAGQGGMVTFKKEF